MTVSLTHTFVSAIADGADTSVVRPSNWNAEHTLSMATGKMLGRTTAGTGAFEEITIGSGLSLSAGSLSATASGGTVTSVAALTLGTTGTDLSSTVATGTTTPVITLQVPTASATNRGALSAADWTTFNSKQATITFGTGVQTALGVNVGTAGSVVVNGGALGTPSSGTLTSATGLPVATGISGLGTGIATALAVNTGSAGAPVLFNGAGGTPSSLTLTNATGLPAAGGGTGQSVYAVGDILYASTTTALSKLADVATGNALISGGVGVAPSWGKIDLTTHVSGILPSANGGTGMAFFTVAGPATSAKTFTFPDASATVLTDNAAVTVAQGGTGRQTGTTAYALVATGTTATGAQQTLANGATTEVLVGGGAAALPVWTTASGSGAPLRQTSPTLVTPVLGTPSSGTLTNCTGLPIGGITQNTARLLGRTTAAAGATEEITVGSGLTLSAGSLTATGGSGTVTSVGWTGGIVSVATATTTPAFTIAGTSGGIPYFSSASTWATSAALAANALVIGGGAGAAPATTTTGTGVVTALGVAVGSAGAFVTFNGALGTPSSGTVTNLTGTASININGTVGATTPASGSFTTITGSGLVDISGASAGQIKFPASQNASANANTLDDYEEGTCTLTWLLGGSSTGFTFTLQVGWYTKVGNLVTVGWNMLTSARGSGTGALTWSGLPFSTANATGGMMGYTEKLTSITCPQFYINIGAPTVMNILADAVGNSITNTNLDAATNYVRGSFSYNT